MKDGLNKKELPVPISTHRGLGTGGIPSLLVASNNNITDLNYYIALYDGSIRYADDCIGELIKTLKELKLENKTMVIISSDHGEGLGEHGLYFTHGSQLYDELIKVPLIIKYKAITPNPKKIVTQVRHIDIAPTILDFLHIKKPASMKGDSLKNIIFKKSLLFPEFAFSQWRDRVSLRTEGWKLIYYGKKNNYELYNLKIDPGELINLIDVEKDKFQYFKKILSSYKIIYEPNRRDSKENLTEDMQERLRSLGYAQ
jgi:arylsulfatase A-like enzyme